MAPTYLWSRQSWLSTSGQGHGNTRELGGQACRDGGLTALSF
jgi:hypothetical protein